MSVPASRISEATADWKGQGDDLLMITSAINRNEGSWNGYDKRSHQLFHAAIVDRIGLIRCHQSSDVAMVSRSLIIAEM